MSRNLRILMDRAQWTQRDLAGKSGISQRQISNILQMTTTCSVETADALAKPFNLEGWHLILPNLPLELVHSSSIGKLLKAYTQGSEATRTYLDSIADREAKLGNDNS